MMLVVSTLDLQALNQPAISKILNAVHAVPAVDGFEGENAVYQYFHIDDQTDTDLLVEQLLEHPEILSAYIKPADDIAMF